MTTLTLDRPSVARLASSLFDAVLSSPGRLAHAREMQAEVERVLALSDSDLAEMHTTREVLLRAIAQKA